MKKNILKRSFFGAKKRRGKFTAGDTLFVVTCVVLIAYVALLVWLMVWGLLTSFKDYYADFGLGNVAGFPKKWTIDNYKTVFANFYRVSGGYKVDAFGIILYTLLYTVGCAFFTTAAPCAVAYVVARFGKKYRWLNLYTSVVLVCLILPIVGNYPSELKLVQALGMYQTIWGMWILKAHFLSMYYLVFYGAFASMPEGYAEAAKIDGAGNFTVCFRIYLPLARILFGTIMLIQFITFWNDFQTPLLYLGDAYPTIAYWLFRFNEATTAELATVPVKTAGMMVLVVPIFIIFLFFNKKIMGNLSLGGIKE